MSSTPCIRRASLADAASLLQIYAPYVQRTATSFEAEPPSAQEFAERIERSNQSHAWLLMERDGETIGYAYAGPHRARAAYRYSAESSVYLRQDVIGRGLGRVLYTRLLAELQELGVCQVFAGITLPNPPSTGLHQSLGFQPIGVFRKVGFKFDQWHDVAWFQLELSESPRGAAAELPGKLS